MYPPKNAIALPVYELIGGTHKLGQSLDMPTQGEAVGGWVGTVRKSVGDFLYALHTYYSSISTRLHKILDCSFEWGVQGCEPPIWGKGRPYGVGGGTVRKSVGEFL